MPGAGAEEAAAGLAAGAAAAAVAAVEADLFTPPWPEQAPRPECEVLPSLQVTVPPLEAGADAGAGAVGAAGAALPEELEPAEADLLTPPCPEQAPRPECVDVVPSLHVTVVVEAEEVEEDDVAAGAAAVEELAPALPEPAELPAAEADLSTPP